ncbi:MFS transporter, MHS family, proline/betaine transporter [Jatrophihabitans endophyticus]|uniref:Putative proline/betaine transporter n=1 Tax=Jatrophihabitans endophyticus TaxID=1206085 RepID=A0A1M5BX86_9ACTN|nr:MFS transporter [Jatrophihabitans endophyticus]SHF47109.1 MFS transporter, MHS family, proline/betaine transporter [Jatrophihabitans endophyticus]
MTVLTPRERPRRWTLDDVVVTDPPVIRKAIGAAAIGNITEWYDFGVYAYLEPTIKDIFFSGLSDSLGTIATFGTFAVAFLVRPFGGMFFGPLADRIGRNKVLAITMIMMALGTFAIGCLPTQAAVGFWAPALLLLCRLVQGFSTGGEYGNAMTFIAEYAPDKRRGFLGSWLEFGTFSGYLGGAIVATIVQDVVGDPALHDWAWRIPFFVALPLGVAGVYLRSRLADTPAYAALEKESEEKEKANKTGDEAKILAGLWPFVLVCMGLVIVWNVTNYMLTSYMPTYISETLPAGDKVTTLTSSVLQIIVMAVALLTIPFIGLLSDRIGRKPIIVGGSVGLIVLALPMVLLIRAGSAVSIFCGLLIMGLALITFSATMPSTLPSLFPTKVRGAGLSVAFNVAISLFAGTTSVVVGALVSATGDLNWPAYYLIAAGVVGLVAVYFLHEPNGRRMWGSAPAAESTQAARELVAEQDEHA